MGLNWPFHVNKISTTTTYPLKPDVESRITMLSVLLQTWSASLLPTKVYLILEFCWYVLYVYV